MERVGIPKPFNDESSRPHATGYDSKIANSSSNSAFSGNEDIFSKVVLLGDIVVMAVDPILWIMWVS